MISGDLAFYITLGFAAQLVDGALGMAYGLIATSVLLASGAPPALSSVSVQRRTDPLKFWHIPLDDRRRFHLEPEPCRVELQANLGLALGRKDALEKCHSKAAVRRLHNGGAILLGPREMKIASPLYCDNVPLHRHTPFADRQRPIARGICREFVKCHA